MENNIIRLEDVVQDDSGAVDYYSLRAWDEMIDEYDATWYMQTHDSLMGLVSCGRIRINGYLDQANQRINGSLDIIRKQIETLAVCAAVSALGDKKEFDMKVSYPVAGTNRKDCVIFNGWKLIHFEKIYKFDNGQSFAYRRKTNWDFVLGEDGEIYHVTSGYAIYDNPARPIGNGDEFFYIVRKAIFFDTCILNNRNQAYFIAVSHGAFLTINQLLEYPEVVSGDFRFKTSDGYDEYFFNFPLQPNGKAEVGVQHIHDLLWSFLPSDMTEEGYQEMEQQLKTEEQARLAKLEAERQAEEQKRQENIQKERERLEAQRQAEEAEAKQREREAREQSIAKAKQRIKELEQERKDVNTELTNTHGIFSGKKRQQLQNKLDSIDKEIKCLQDL